MLILIVGRLGSLELITINTVFNINVLAFMPMMDCRITVMVKVEYFQNQAQTHLFEDGI
ncbi:MAG: hypothetical protein GY866_43540 [Proteobacteria bacterium]|nr:hypothetical protein [Pseudomonadota bacterium]